MIQRYTEPCDLHSHKKKSSCCAPAVEKNFHQLSQSYNQHSIGWCTTPFVNWSVKLGLLCDSISNSMWLNFHVVTLKKRWDNEPWWYYEVEVGRYNNLPRYMAPLMIWGVKLGGLRDSISNNMWINFHAVILKRRWENVTRWFWGVEFAHKTIHHTSNERYIAPSMIWSMKLREIRNSI